MTVTALLVSHDGARWLPAVLAGLAGQQVAPDRVLAVDTGSTDTSQDLLVDALGAAAVAVHPGSFPEAVRHALGAVDTEWVWLLHDDANPEPDALAALLAAADRTGADILGPKLREWPSLRRLLELGVTISGSGRRETGLERGEYDQGQHDEVREVLAVNTAGILVRRSVLERLGGFDHALPVYGNDIDFGWRATRAGYRTVVVPQALVFHAEAAHRGVRTTPLTGTRPHRTERAAAIHTLLANTQGPRVVWTWFRLAFGTVLRALGFLLARSPRLAVDEVAAWLSVNGRPGRLLAARRARRDLGDEHDDDVRRLLAPWWLPYRHGLDFVTDVGSAVANQGRDAAERRRVQRTRETGPVADEAEGLEADSGLLVRLVTSPLALAVTAFLVVCLVGTREAWGPLAGGALSPAPERASEWWSMLGRSWHEIGQGTDAPAPAYLIPLALVGTVLLGSATAAVSALFLLAVPVAAWGAWRFGRVVVELATGHRPQRWLLAWASLAYATVPVASGAWSQGRFSVLASAALLPWLGHAALGMLEGSADRRWRAGWRCSLLLAVVTAFTPVAWLLAVVLVVVAAILLGVVAPSLLARRSVWGPLLVAVLTPVVLLLPGAVGMLGHDLSALFLEAGRAVDQPGALDLLAGRFPEPAASRWWGLLLVLPAVLALARVRTRTTVVACWLLVCLTTGLAAVLSRVEIDLPAGTTTPGLGFALVLVQAALVVAVLVAAHGLGAAFRGASFGWRQPLAVVLAAAALLAPLGGLAWWLTTDDDLLARPGPSVVPVYMTQAAEDGAEHGVLLVRGDVADGFSWRVHRGDGVRLGEDEILALTSVDLDLDADVAALVADPGADVVGELAGHGLDYVVMPAPADARVAASFDATSGLVRASTAERDTRAWQLEQPASPDAISGEGSSWHPWLLVIQGIAIVVVAVLCGPSRREGR